MSNTYASELSQQIATPGLFARYVSRDTSRPWRMARHMAVLDRELTDIATGANKRLIVQMPPRHGKSMLTSCYFPAYYLGVHPQRNVILTSATDDLASDFSGMARDTVAEWGHLFGISLRQDKASVQRWELEQGGSLRAAGVGSGRIMGRSADLLLIDDYFPNVEAALSEVQRTKLYQWFLSTSGTRLTPDGAIVIVATRWHGKDLIGCVLKAAEELDEQWRVVSFPALGDDGAALWPEQWPTDKLEPTKRKMYASGYPWLWEALYQQNPPDVLDAEFPPEYFSNIWFDEWPRERKITVVALDPSLGKTDKSDYSAFICAALGNDGCYYIDANIARRPSSKLVAEGIAWMGQFRPDLFGCEKNQFQELLLPLFEAEIHRVGLTMHDVYGISNDSTSNKLTRIRRLTHLLATGRIKVRRGSPGAALLVEQLKGFPAHKHDDGPDALEMAIRLCNEMLGGSGLEEPEEVMFA